MLRDYGIVIAFLALFLSLTFLSPYFLTERNLLNILDQWSAVGIMACGMTLVLIAGGFDLSAGAVYALAGVIAAKLAIEWGPASGLLLGALAGLAVGVINGLLVTVGRINAFVATLGTGLIVAGLATAISSGHLVVVDDSAFTVLGRSDFLGAKYSVYLFAGTLVVLGIVLHRTHLGRYIYAVGGNREAARLSGIRVGLITTAAFTICGLTAGLGGIIAASRIGTGQADAGGYTLLFNVFAAVIIGGTSILGGSGAIWRTLVGVLLLAMIGNGLNLLNVDATYQSIIIGCIILTAVSVDVWSRRER